MSSTTIASDVRTQKTPPGAFRMPAESARHSYTLLAFPKLESAQDEEHWTALKSEVTQIANAISRFEPVHLYACEELLTEAQSMVGANISVKPASVSELWIRDSGPIFVQDLSTEKRTAVKFNFNYWGNKINLAGDEKVAAEIADQEGEISITSTLTLEGGAVEHDGEGAFLGTESSIINDNRNPGLTKSDVEAELTAMLGVTHFIWLPGHKGFDITDHHIDVLARFTSPGVVLLSKPGQNAHPVVVEVYNSARSILASARDAKGRRLIVHECEEPDTTQLGPPLDEFNQVIASYCNYLVVNGGIVLPSYGQEKQDTAALELLKRLFPDREVVQVLINSLPRTGGGIHCATQQVPEI